MIIDRNDYPNLADLSQQQAADIQAIYKEIQSSVDGDVDNFIATHQLDGQDANEVHYSLDFKGDDVTISLAGSPEHGEMVVIQTMTLNNGSSPR